MIAFVLGGGGLLGAVEVGMLHALVDADIRPDLVVGSSVGAINGAAYCTGPSQATMERMTTMWEALGRDGVFSGGVIGRLSTLTKTRTHLHDNDTLRALIEKMSPGLLIEDLPVRFECIAACIEKAAGTWFTSGSLTDAILASSAVPGLLPPVLIDGLHYFDGGLVNSIPVGRALALGATTVYVLQVGRVERPLAIPKWPWEVATIAFELSRRHRYAEEMASIPEGVEVHVLPTGGNSDTLSNVRYRDTSRVRERIARAREATARYLVQQG